jgi:enoyl-CoA hydratase/carnithine racemase
MSEETVNDQESQDFIRYECRDRIATITFNRPAKLNAFNDAMVMRLARVLHDFDIDETADVAILRGEGRAFCSGADVHQRQLRSEVEFRKHGGSQGWGAHAADLLTRAVNWKPVIAAAHGYAVGLGLGMEL